MSHLVKSALLGGVALLALVPQSSFAQDASDTGADASAEYRGPMLDEIVVVAQKRAEDAQDVPLSITALGGEDLKENNVNDVGALASFVPNMEVIVTPTINLISMRGLGSGYNKGFEQSVATLVDEVYYGRASYLSNGLLDLEVVEVLRGPQGTLFGKNSVAGALHFRTASPDYDWGVSGDVLYGERNELRVGGTLTGPIIEDRIAFRVAVQKHDRDGDMYNVTRDKYERNINNRNARAKLLFDVTDNLSLTWSASVATVDQDGPGYELVKIPSGPDGATPFMLEIMQTFEPQTNANGTDERVYSNAKGFVTREAYDSVLNAVLDIGEFTVTSITAVGQLDEDARFDADFSPIPFLELQNDEDYEFLSQELRVTSPLGDLEYVAGLHFFYNSMFNKQQLPVFLMADGPLAQVLDITVPGAGASLLPLLNPLLDPLGGPQEAERRIQTLDQESYSYAAFGQATWHVTETFAATVGARLTYEEKSVTAAARYIGLLATPLGEGVIFPAVQSGAETFTVERSRDELDISPKASVSWTPEIEWGIVDDFMLYGTAAVGYKGGGFSDAALNPEQLEFEEENSLTLEAGFKSTLLDGAGRANITYFHTTFDDLQVSSFNGVSFVTSNAASAVSQGVEFEFQFVPIWGLFIGVSGAYINASFDEFKSAPCPAEKDTDSGVCDLSGRPLSSAPKWNGTVSVNYDRQLFNMPFRVLAGVSAQLKTFEYFNTDLDPFNSRDASAYWRGRIGIKDVDDVWSFIIHGDNLSNIEDFVFTNDLPVFTGTHFGERMPLRSIAGEFRLTF
ncbi:MAG: TonB-dependent receptor [Alphaproteobacteria bacterium]